MKKIYCVFFLLVLAGCQAAQAEPIPQTPIVEIRDPSPSDQPVFYECTPGGNVTVTAEAESPSEVMLSISGLQPNERVKFAFQPAGEDWENYYTTFDPVDPADEGGNFVFLMPGFELSEGFPRDWTVKVIHANGVTCQDFNLPK